MGRSQGGGAGLTALADTLRCMRSSHDEPLPVRRVTAASVLRWLQLGAGDLARVPAASLAQGLVVAAGGWVVIWLAQHAWWLAPGAFSAFAIVGPILCTGLYELSRLLGRGQTPGLADALAAWRRDAAPLVQLGFVLGGIALAWVAVSAALFAAFVTTPLATPMQFLRYAAVDQGNLLFMLWLMLGGLTAAVVFALTVVSPPLLLGRRVGLRRALLTSVRAVGENPLPLALWAGFIMLAIALSMATAMLGFVVAVPLIGHATWHAYKDLVVTDGVPLRAE
ncbi:MAG: DUF2189 domain-containing protein [Betaproteobacteria bacterium]